MSARLNAQFLTSASSLEDAPADAVFEVAFAGRSNAGKSSVLNCLAGSAKLARTSKTPGRTQRFNYFDVAVGGHLSGRLVDLPGYGYAKVSRRISSAWQENILRYLHLRAQLHGLVLVMDARHAFRASDLDVIQACKDSGLPVLALLNKSDKLSKSASLQGVREGRQTLAPLSSTHDHVLSFSARTGEGAPEARAWIEARLRGE